MKNFQPKGWYDRRRLPHFDDGYSFQFLTTRLADSVPLSVIDGWQRELEHLGDFGKLEMRRRVEKYLDKGYGECHLKKRPVAEIVRDSLFFNDGKTYSLKSWVIMPNHVHVLLRQAEGVALEEITQAFKSYTAHIANKLLGRRGEFWQAEVFDRYIRDDRHYTNVINYIENNPVKARLCNAKEDWEFGSAWWGVQGGR
jgi:putative DNA methylase